MSDFRFRALISVVFQPLCPACSLFLFRRINDDDIHFGYKMIHSSRETEKAVNFSTCITPHVLPTQYDRRELITRIWPDFYLHYLTR